jgi:hypothetical protein
MGACTLRIAAISVGTQAIQPARRTELATLLGACPPRYARLTQPEPPW